MPYCHARRLGSRARREWPLAWRLAHHQVMQIGCAASGKDDLSFPKAAQSSALSPGLSINPFC